MFKPVYEKTRIAAPLPDHISTSTDEDRIDEGGKIRHDFRPGCPFLQSPEHTFTARLKDGLR